MRFGSVCSGIEAASVAWHPLGWRAAWFSEIEPFPCAVLAHHYPEVPNHGDMTALPQLIRSGKVEAPDLFCGGTPCQAFSVAGLRRSLDDERGNLSLTFVEIADAIDDVRRARGDAECIVFWENVPGVLSTQDNAFGCFLGALAGCDTAIEPLAATGWTDAGVVAGPVRTVAWRILDAQYFGVAQRRRRVFVVASARADFDPAAVLLEWEGVRRDSAPSREAGQKPAPTIAGCANGGGANGPGRDVDSVESLVCMSSGQANAEVRTDGGAPALTCLHEAPIVTHSLRGEGFDASEDGTGRGTPLVPVAHVDTMPTMLNGANTPAGHNARSGHTKDQYIVPVAHAFDARQSDVLQYGDKAGPLDTDGHSIGVAIPIDTMNHLGRGDSHSFGDFQPGAPSYTLTKGHSHAVAVAVRTANTSANGHGISAELAHTLDQAQGQAVAVPMVNMQGSKGNAVAQGDGPSFTLNAMHGHDVHAVLAPTLTASNDPSRSPQSSEITAQVAAIAASAMQVRRLTPVECERLMGFPDSYTAIRWRGKPASECPDGPRYKALGNSWAVPCVRWIGRRIAAQIA